MPIGSGRQTQFQQVHYFRKRILFNSPSAAAGIMFGTMPIGAMITDLDIRVSTAFNAATTNAINVGITATGSEIFTDAATAGHRQPTIPNISFATDTDLFCSYAQTGAAATAGVADFVIGFAPNNDQ